MAAPAEKSQTGTSEPEETPDAQNTRVQKRWRMNLEESLRQQYHKQLEEADEKLKRGYEARLEQEKTKIREDEEQKFNFRFHREFTKYQCDFVDGERQKNSKALDHLKARWKDGPQMNAELCVEQDSHKMLKRKYNDLEAQLDAERATKKHMRDNSAKDKELINKLLQELQKKEDWIEATDSPMDEAWSDLYDIKNAELDHVRELLRQQRISGGEKSREAKMWKAKAEALQHEIRELTVKKVLPTPDNNKKADFKSMRLEWDGIGTPRLVPRSAQDHATE
ncbi:hypothetical protein IWX49DRAFT_571271 [Phyllosticta citricarpa]|uniref:Uncharacterized protein n=1 Tax=Phyllosticta citricarpa TaxID=55181 RepID=A0ABR1MS11_9PEZI